MYSSVVLPRLDEVTLLALQDEELCLPHCCKISSVERGMLIAFSLRIPPLFLASQSSPFTEVNHYGRICVSFAAESHSLSTREGLC